MMMFCVARPIIRLSKVHVHVPSNIQYLQTLQLACYYSYFLRIPVASELPHRVVARISRGLNYVSDFFYVGRYLLYVYVNVTLHHSCSIVTLFIEHFFTSHPSLPLSLPPSPPFPTDQCNESRSQDPVCG